MPLRMPKVSKTTKFNPAKVDTSNMPVIYDPHEIKKLREGQQFLATFIHDPKGDSGWHTKQNMKDLISGKLIRHGLPPSFWELYSDKRPPICRRKENTFEILG